MILAVHQMVKYKTIILSLSFLLFLLSYYSCYHGDKNDANVSTFRGLHYIDSLISEEHLTGRMILG